MSEVLTVGELKEALSAYADDLKVVVNGCEDGYDEISKISVMNLKVNPDKMNWDGKYIDGKANDEIFITLSRC